MSEITSLQKQIQEPENQSLQPTQDSLQEEVMVDTLALEDEQVLSGERTENTSQNARADHLDEVSDAVNSIPAVLDASLFEDVEFDEVPPMIRAIRLLDRLLDADLAERALESGDDGALTEVRTALLEMVEQGLNPGQVQSFYELSAALSEGRGRLENGEVDAELVVSDIDNIKSIVDSGIVATDAVYSEIWEEDDETILAFQNLSQSEADEVQKDLAELDEETVAPVDRQKIQAEGVTAIEVEEVLVDFWEAAQNEEYEVVEDEDVD